MTEKEEEERVQKQKEEQGRFSLSYVFFGKGKTPFFISEFQLYVTFVVSFCCEEKRVKRATAKETFLLLLFPIPSPN